MANHSTADNARRGGQLAPFHDATAAFFPRDAAGAAIERVAGGFSGSPVAKVVLPGGTRWSVKALPEAVEARRGRWVHGLMRHLRKTPLPFVPEVAEASPGVTLWQDSRGRLWEMLSWMPGSPRLQPSEAERAAALHAVAGVHVSAAGFADGPAAVGVSPAVEERASQCRRLLEWGWPQPSRWPAWGEAATSGVDRLAEGRIREAIASATVLLTTTDRSGLHRVAQRRSQPGALLAVVRDLTAEHLLFADGGDAIAPPRVTGLLDFHAARVDAPACDLARLLASWHRGLPAPAVIRDAVVRYAQSTAELGRPAPNVAGLCHLVELLVATGIVLGMDNWIRWIVVEQRHFADWAAVADRVELHAAALGPALQRLADLPLGRSIDVDP